MLNTFETLLKVKVYSIINNILTYMNNYIGKTDMHSHFPSKPECMVSLVLSIDQVLQKGNSKCFKEFIAKLVFRRRHVLI